MRTCDFHAVDGCGCSNDGYVDVMYYHQLITLCMHLNSIEIQPEILTFQIPAPIKLSEILDCGCGCGCGGYCGYSRGLWIYA